MSGLTAEAALASELWISFFSLLRSYAAVAGPRAQAAVDVAATEHGAVVTAGEARLAVEGGAWRVERNGHAEGAGTLELLEDGSARLDGTRVDLDHAAIDLIAGLTRAAAAGKGR